MRVNGTAVFPVDPAVRLLDYLRDDLGLTGAKEGCGMGECGSCTVLMDGRTVCACLVLVGQAPDADIVTVEGLPADAHTEQLRDALVSHQAVQCGFCIPGIVVSAHALNAANLKPTDEQVRRGLEGNLCRCTGYQRMVQAIRSVGR